ncbi:MAG TPA: fatty acid desaturase [Ferrovibrio sp.]|uniref:fatty acid desaturase n=1 Tax=Ferrovibrio sp. TaxID=1917215 RepID=UPI002ED5063B
MAVAAFQTPSLAVSLWQVLNSFLPFLGLCAAMYACLEIGLPYWAVLPLAVLAAGFAVRIFIIQHDCGHGAFFRARWANDALGRFCSLFTFTPFDNWRRWHASHHATCSNLDRRVGSRSDVYSSCLTVDEYNALSRFGRLRYRILQHPVVAQLIMPTLIFLLIYRLPLDTPKSWRRERWSVWLTNLALAGLALLLGFTLGFDAVLKVQLPIIMVAATIGVWLFAVQHRFEGTVWVRQGAWSGHLAALDGSSFLKLPRLLQWFTGNIGYHHVHHLNPRVPNYRLQDCHDAIEALQAVPAISLWAAFRGHALALWDEAACRMVRFPRKRKPMQS